MAFVSGTSISTTAGVSYPLPSVVDAGASGPTLFLYSHMRIPAGPATVTFDNGRVVTVGLDSVIAIPAAARQFSADGALPIQLGRMVG